MGTVFVGGVTLIWYIVLGPATQGADFDLTDLVNFAYPIGDVLLLFGALSLLWRGGAPGAPWCRCASSPPACWCSSPPTSPTAGSPCTRPISAATRSTRSGSWR